MNTKILIVLFDIKLGALKMKSTTQLNIRKIVKQIATLIVFTLFILNCQSIEDKWEKVKKENTIEAYQRFIETNPDNKFEYLAKHKIDSLRFTLVKDSNSVKSYKNFIKLYPNSYYYNEAQDSIVSLKFKKILNNSSIDSLRKFTKEYPTHSLAQKADSLIIQMFNEQIQQAKTYAEKDKIENKIIEDILNNGVGKRFLIKELLPQNKNKDTFIFGESKDGKMQTIDQNAIQSITIDAINSIVKTLYPKDKIMSTLTTMGIEILFPDSHCGIYRFIGKVKFSEEYTFVGQKEAPLTFMYLDKKGFVYLHGYGKVLKNSQIIKSFFKTTNQTYSTS